MNNWSEEDTTIVLAEYCRRGLGQIHHRDAHVIELGALIGRSPSAVVRKVGNLAHFDPTLRERNVRGLSHASKLDRLVWDKYNGKWDQLALDASTYLAARKKLPLEELFTVPPGAERKYLVKQRIHQDFFRQAVLSSYRWRCCITGLGHHSLLEACHIVGWNVDESQRTNPSNGLCMNVLFHRAYDKHLMGITPDGEVLISETFFDHASKEMNESFMQSIRLLHRNRLCLPERFLPAPALLELHYKEYLQHNNA